MGNKEFERFTKTGNIKDYLKYKESKKNGDKDGSKGRTGHQGNSLPR